MLNLRERRGFHQLIITKNTVKAAVLKSRQ